MAIKNNNEAFAMANKLQSAIFTQSSQPVHASRLKLCHGILAARSLSFGSGATGGSRVVLLSLALGASGVEDLSGATVGRKAYSTIPIVSESDDESGETVQKAEPSTKVAASPEKAVSILHRPPRGYNHPLKWSNNHLSLPQRIQP